LGFRNGFDERFGLITTIDDSIASVAESSGEGPVFLYESKPLPAFDSLHRYLDVVLHVSLAPPSFLRNTVSSFLPVIWSENLDFIGRSADDGLFIPSRTVSLNAWTSRRAKQASLKPASTAAGPVLEKQQKQPADSQI